MDNILIVQACQLCAGVAVLAVVCAVWTWLVFDKDTEVE